MRLQNKTLLITVISVIAMFGLLFVVLSFVVWSGFASLEQQDIRERVARVQRSLHEELDFLATTTGDWAFWDATYEFVALPNEDYVLENLTPESLVSLGVNAVLYIDVDGNVIRADCVDLATGCAVELFEGLRSRKWASDPVTRFEDPLERHDGVLMLPRGPMLIAARAILKSDQHGPARGTLLMGRWLGLEQVQRFSEPTTSSIEIVSIPDFQRSGDLGLAAFGGNSESGADIRFLDKRHAEGVFVVEDIYGDPAFVCRVPVPRRITMQGRVSLAYVAMGLVVCGLVFAVLVWRLQARLVLDRLLALVHELQNAGCGGETPRKRISVPGTDELAMLGDAIDHMADRLEQNRQRLEQACCDAEQSSRQKSEFLANMSHEIRTPMTAILGYAELLEEMAIDGFGREALQIIKRNGEHLLLVINDILDMSKIEANKLQIEARNSSPRELVEEIVSLMEVRVTQSKVRLKASWEGPIPRQICTDPTRLRQILLNLVGNAVKFTDEGDVAIVTRCTGMGTPDAWIEFDVIDSGVGMTREQVSALFVPFAQADASTTRIHGGTGLGLAISQRLAHVLGGNISVRSTLGQGSTFRLRLPAGDPTDQTCSEFEPISVDQQSCVARKLPGLPSPCRILLAEDGPDNQRLIDLLLRKAGAEVTVANNGKEACEILLARRGDVEPFHLVIMDMQMPIMDGYEATRRLRQEGCRLPILALTAHAMVGEEEKCRNAGCDAYLTKPINRECLLITVAEAIRLHEPQRDAAVGTSSAGIVAR